MRYASRLIQKGSDFRSVDSRLRFFSEKIIFSIVRRTVRALEINKSIKYAKKVLILNTVLLLKIVTENGKVCYGKDTVDGLNSEPLMCSNLL
jgi:hypothetical protein